MELILQKWNEIIESIKIEHEVSNIAFTTWLVPLKPYKLEGNTLLILTPKELAISYIERKCSEICARLQSEFKQLSRNKSIMISVSIGISFGDEKTDSFRKLYKKAGKALQNQRKSGRNGYSF